MLSPVECACLLAVQLYDRPLSAHPLSSRGASQIHCPTWCTQGTQPPHTHTSPSHEERGAAQRLRPRRPAEAAFAAAWLRAGTREGSGCPRRQRREEEESLLTGSRGGQDLGVGESGQTPRTPCLAARPLPAAAEPGRREDELYQRPRAWRQARLGRRGLVAE